MKKEFSKSKLIFNMSMVALISSAILTASVMTGCSSDSGDQNGTEVITETQYVTEVNGVFVDGDGNILDEQGSTTGETIPNPPNPSNKDQGSDSKNSKSGSSSSSKTSQSDKSGSDKSSSKQSSKSGESSKQSSKSGESSKQSSKQSSKSGESSKQSSKQSSQSSKQSSKKTNADSSKTLKIGNQSFSVGDTVTCTYSIQMPEDTLNYQGQVAFDNTYLRVIKAKLQKPASSGGILNDKLSNEVLFNGSSLDGYDYKNGGAFLMVQYEVLKEGSTSPSLNWEIITGMSGKKYSSGGSPTNGLTVTESYE